MGTTQYLKVLVEDIHSAVVATLDGQGRPVTRCIDMMLYDDDGVYFLTARSKAFYTQLMEQQYVSVSAVKDQRCVSLSGKVRNIGKRNLDCIFEHNPYMDKLYPGRAREVLEVFQIYDACGNYFDISDPEHVRTGAFTIPA